MEQLKCQAVFVKILTNCGYSTMVVHLVANQGTGVRFPLPAPAITFASFRKTLVQRFSETLSKLLNKKYQNAIIPFNFPPI